MPASIALMPVSVSALPSKGSITMMSTPLLIRVSTWLICWLTSLVPSTASRVTSLVLAGLALGVGRDRADPAVVGLRGREADGDRLAGLVVVLPPALTLRGLGGAVGRASSLLLVQAVSTAPAPSAPAPTRKPRRPRAVGDCAMVEFPPERWGRGRRRAPWGSAGSHPGIGGGGRWCAGRRVRSPVAARGRRPPSGARSEPSRVVRLCSRTAATMIRPLAMSWTSVARLLRMKMFVIVWKTRTPRIEPMSVPLPPLSRVPPMMTAAMASSS